MHRNWLAFGALLASLGVALGAFGAHALAERVTPDALVTWRTAAQYHQIHAVAIVVLASFHSSLGRISRFALPLLATGTILFGGSLYALVLTGQRLWGAVAPLGGASLIFGWILLSAVAWERAEG
ncbi:MAG: DUF423 domain-containing protein [Fimbriimonas sp.]